ncbi:hypothetical protein [Sporosarcina sp. Marseille-Q4943]|uniref:hypothetical protein n=1 Tax=Sporosarcina sp. Marseille-Q4943 TaxID=2942204 RepID=UPI00208DA528|nr:hypothetical protein [Sporosarcina sp. Marseille-Q4943]
MREPRLIAFPLQSVAAFFISNLKDPSLTVHQRFLMGPSVFHLIPLNVDENQRELSSSGDKFKGGGDNGPKVGDNAQRVGDKTQKVGDNSHMHANFMKT